MKQYNHYRSEYTNSTLSLETPDKQFLHHMFIQHANQSMFMLGLAVHAAPDQFQKKIGRDIADARLTPTLVHLKDIVQVGTKHHYYFDADVKVKHRSYKLKFVLTTVLESDDVHLIASEIK